LAIALWGAADEAAIRVILPSEQPTAGWVESRPLTPSELAFVRSQKSETVAKTLEVRVVSEAELPPILGGVELAGGRLVFRPRFPWRSGLAYRATLNLPGTQPSETLFLVPEVSTRPQTRVTRVLPDVESIPANLLRFYLEFSAPMHPGSVLPSVELLDEHGRLIAEPFVETAPLWDSENRRVTLICHPGRIKRGLELHERTGAPLASTRRVTLRVLRTLPDANAQPLIDDYSREFAVRPADRDAPNPNAWTWKAPMAGTSEALEIDFEEPLDVALVSRMLRVVGPDEEPVPGEIRVEPDGTGWTFRPSSVWLDDRYDLEVAPGLEDLSGNRVDGRFEREPTEATASPSAPTVLCVRGCIGR
jgi:hypothetical protein